MLGLGNKVGKKPPVKRVTRLDTIQKVQNERRRLYRDLRNGEIGITRAAELRRVLSTLADGIALTMGERLEKVVEQAKRDEKRG